MHDAFDRIENTKIDLHAVKTDANHVAKRNLNKTGMMRNVFDFNNEIGGWRKEDKNMVYIPGTFGWKYNELPEIPIFTKVKEKIWKMNGGTGAICKKAVRRKKHHD